MSVRNWCFTHNDFTSSLPPDTLPDGVKFLAWQLEKAPTTGHLHLQGYMQLTTRLRLSSAKAVLQGLFGGQPALFQAKGTPDQNLAYVTKEEGRVDGPYVMGTMTKSGDRNDLKEFTTAVVDRKRPLSEVATAFPEQWLKYHRGAQSLRAAEISRAGGRRPNFRLLYLCGPHNTGKSTAADEVWPDAYPLTEHKDGWMGSYDGQDTLIIDDFAGILPITFMLRLCQTLRFEGWTKGGQVVVAASTVIVISNLPPEEVYTNSPRAQYDAWLSRLTPERRGHVLRVSSQDRGKISSMLREWDQESRPTQTDVIVPESPVV